MSVNIAIDGPAGAGKSTIAKLLAKRLGYLYVDTGAMYRALALYMVEGSITLSDEEAVVAALPQVRVTLAHLDGEQHVYLNDRDVSKDIRKEEIGNAASAISGYPAVREKLLSLQRDLAKAKDCIMDGRDIGSFVLPDAQVKIYLTASSGTRAKRRYDELAAKGESPDLARIEEDIIKRDEQDKNRSISPLIVADDAVVVDSSELSIDQVVERITEIAAEKGVL